MLLLRDLTRFSADVFNLKIAALVLNTDYFLHYINLLLAANCTVICTLRKYYLLEFIIKQKHFIYTLGKH